MMMMMMTMMTIMPMMMRHGDDDDDGDDDYKDDEGDDKDESWVQWRLKWFGEPEISLHPIDFLPLKCASMHSTFYYKRRHHYTFHYSDVPVCFVGF